MFAKHLFRLKFPMQTKHTYKFIYLLSFDLLYWKKLKSSKSLVGSEWGSLQVSPKKSMNEQEIDALTKRTQDGGTEVVQAKAGKGSATLSMA